MAKKRGPQSGGPATDAAGGPVVDPTDNVKLLVEAGMKRQDDLREMEAKYAWEIHERDRQHLQAIQDLRARCNDELRAAEAKRIDAIRAVDVGAVARAAEVAGDQVEALRLQVANSAEAMRAQVEAARQQTANAQTDALAPLQLAVSELRQVQYEQAGKTASVAESKVDQRSDSGRTWLIIGLVVSAFIGLMGILIGIGGLVYTITQSGP